MKKKNQDNYFIVKDIEELAELIKELTKYLKGQLRKDKLIEELADAQISIEHIKYMFDISDEQIKKIHIQKCVLDKYKK